MLPERSENSTTESEVPLVQPEELSEEELWRSEKKLESSEDNLLPEMVRLSSEKVAEPTEE